MTNEINRKITYFTPNKIIMRGHILERTMCFLLLSNECHREIKS